MDEWIGEIGEVKDLYICNANFDNVYVSIGFIEESVITTSDKIDNIFATFEKDRDFTGTFTITYPQKYNNKTRKFYRNFLFVDLLMVKFPKKKNRRRNRLKRKGILCKF